MMKRLFYVQRGDIVRKIIFHVTIIFVYLFSFLLPSSLPVIAASEEAEITILFTHDLHDNFYPFKTEIDGKVEEVGGFARLYSAIEAERAKDREAILVDAGDYAMGTLFQTVFATHAPTLRIMGEMGYDAITLGNHEFDYRAEGLAEHLEAARKSGAPLPDIVASNIIYPTNEDGTMDAPIEQLKVAMEAYPVTEYKVMEKANLKIGIFGLMGWEAAEKAPLAGVEFTDAVESAKRIVAQLQEKENVDLIIALSHSGTLEGVDDSEDIILAQEVPEIDVIVSGHTHRILEEPIIVDDTYIVSTGEYGKNLGVMKLKQNDRGRYDLQEYRLEPIRPELGDHPQITAAMEDLKELVQKEYLDYFDLQFDEVLAYSPYDFPSVAQMIEEHSEAAIGNLIGDAYIHMIRENEGEDYQEITAAVALIGTIRSSFYAGDITTSDVFNVSSLGIGPDKVPGYPLIEVYLTGKELKTTAEVDASIAPLVREAQLYISGLSYSFNPHRLIFNKVTDVHIQREDGTLEEIEDDKLYRVVVGLYTAQMLPLVGERSFNLLSIVPKKADGTPIEDFEEQILYLNDGTQREIKEWYALAKYLQSFEKVNGIPQIPEKYAKPNLQRKIVEPSKNIIDLVKKPNGIALTLYGIIIGLVIVIVLVARFIYKWRKRRKMRQGLEQKQAT